jgi:hypothetical protein
VRKKSEDRKKKENTYKSSPACDAEAEANVTNAPEAAGEVIERV